MVETLKLNRHDKFDETEAQITVIFKYHAGFAGCGPTYSHGGLPPEPDEVEILKIENEWGQDITDLISEEEYQWIEDKVYDDWKNE